MARVYWPSRSSQPRLLHLARTSFGFFWASEPSATGTGPGSKPVGVVTAHSGNNAFSQRPVSDVHRTFPGSRQGQGRQRTLFDGCIQLEFNELLK